LPVPLYVSHGRGSRKWDVDGNEYIDFHMGNGALLLGHAEPDILAAIVEATQRGTHFGHDHPAQIEWAELVQKLVPSAERVRFVNSGTEATLLALRLARAYTGRPKFLRFEGHFHGWHDDVIHGFQPPFDQDGSLGVHANVWQHFEMIPDGDLNRVEQLLARDRDIAAALLEPSGGSWGRVPLDPAFLRGLREITARHGVQLIFDEVLTGFRVSPGGAQGLYGVTPDLSSLAKIVAGGMPGGAVVGRADIMRLFDLTGDPPHDRHERVTHQGTFNAAPLSAAAGIVALKKVLTGQPTRKAVELADRLRARWDDVLEQLGIAGYAYGPPTMFHVYFETDVGRVSAAKRRADLHTCEAARLKGMPGRLVADYQRWLRHYGVDLLSGTGGVLSDAHTVADIDEATDAFRKTVLALRDEKQVLTLG
jgi:glutamate-1-semialdehyde 2,1-aminomutase